MTFEFEKYPELAEQMQEYASFGRFLDWQKFTDVLNNSLIEASKLHQPTVISAVCTCEVNTRRHFETNLNECRFCEKPLIQTDL